MRFTAKKLRESIARLLKEDEDKKKKQSLQRIMPSKELSDSWPKDSPASPDDVDVSSRVLRNLTDEEFAAFSDQLQQRAASAAIKQKKPSSDVSVPAHILRSLDDDEYEAYVDQIMKHGENFPKKSTGTVVDELEPDSTRASGPLRQKRKDSR